MPTDPTPPPWRPTLMVFLNASLEVARVWQDRYPEDAEAIAAEVHDTVAALFPPTGESRIWALDTLLATIRDHMMDAGIRLVAIADFPASRDHYLPIVATHLRQLRPLLDHALPLFPSQPPREETQPYRTAEMR